MTKFRMHHFGYEHLIEWLGKQIDLADQHQVVWWPGVRDHNRHDGSKAEPVQVPPLALQIQQRVRLEQAVCLEETIEFGPRLQPE